MKDSFQINQINPRIFWMPGPLISDPVNAHLERRHLVDPLPGVISTVLRTWTELSLQGNTSRPQVRCENYGLFLEHHEN